MRAPLLYLLFTLTPGNAQQVVTIAGLPPNHRADVDGKKSLDAPLGAVYGVLRDKVTGRLLFHDETVVERLEPDGTLLALAGLGRLTDGSKADGTPASALFLTTLRGIAQDSAGNLYLADAFAGRVYRITADGAVTTFAGGSPATIVPMSSPRGLAFDSKGNLLIAEVGCQCIRRIDPKGTLTTVYTLPPSPTFQYPEGLAIDAADNIYVAIYSGHSILKIAPDGSSTVIAGTGTAGFSGDGGPATNAQLNFPSDLAIATDGTLYIADSGNNRIRRITPDGVITTSAGTGDRGFAGDGGPAAAAHLSLPAQLLLDPDGTLYFGDYGNRRVRRITPDGVIGTVAGSGEFTNTTASIGDGGPAINARLFTIAGTAFDSAGNLFVADAGGYRVRKIAPDSTITTVAGNGKIQSSGDGAPATSAAMSFLLGITLDSQNNIYVSSEDGRIRKIDANGIINTIAGPGNGSGAIRYLGDEGPAVNATLNEPKGIAVDAAGNVYIADTSNARLRMVDRNGIIHLIAAADTSQLGREYWNAVAFDPQGKLYVTITRTGPPGTYSIVSRVNPDGTLSRIAGTGQGCQTAPDLKFTYDGQPATSVPLCIVVGITFDPQGNLYIPETTYGVLLKMTPDGILTRVAGNGDNTLPVDGSMALATSFSAPNVALDAAGNIVAPQTSSGRIREITKTPVALKLSRDHVDLQGSQAQTVGVATNFAEPFTYVVRIKTEDGGAWLSANRTTGQTGESLQIAANPGLAPGTYRGTVTVVLQLPVPQQMDVPVTLTVN